MGPTVEKTSELRGAEDRMRGSILSLLVESFCEAENEPDRTSTSSLVGSGRFLDSECVAPAKPLQRAPSSLRCWEGRSGDHAAALVRRMLAAKVSWMTTLALCERAALRKTALRMGFKAAK